MSSIVYAYFIGETMFKSKINGILKEKGMNTNQLAEFSGLSRQAIFKARQDHSIAECRLSTLGRIAQALGVPTACLYEETYSEGLHQEV